MLQTFLQKKWRLRQPFACRSRVLAASGFRATCLHMRQATATTAAVGVV